MENYLSCQNHAWARDQAHDQLRRNSMTWNKKTKQICCQKMKENCPHASDMLYNTSEENKRVFLRIDDTS